MAAQNTTQIPVGTAWQSVVTGPVAGILLFESTATDCYFAVANATPGFLIDSQPIYGSVNAGNRVSGFTQTSGLERRLAFATPYLARITNRSTTAAATVWYGLTWYEGPLSTEV